MLPTASYVQSSWLPPRVGHLRFPFHQVIGERVGVAFRIGERGHISFSIEGKGRDLALAIGDREHAVHRIVGLGGAPAIRPSFCDCTADIVVNPARRVAQRVNTALPSLLSVLSEIVDGTAYYIIIHPFEIFQLMKSHNQILIISF